MTELTGELWNKIKEWRLEIEMPDGSTWAIPVSVVAIDRATYYVKEGEYKTLQESLDDDTLPLFIDNEYDIHDWAANNMNWSDVKRRAVKIKDPDVDYQDGWMNGEYKITKE